ncbi:MAG: hypothetical protein JXL81_09290 [Deltaproteobacteria bacterium]|nr:hypothetical protein [Deltaproteobacteria bacterium]
MEYVKISIKVERRIEDLRQSGKTGKIIAGKAESIIEAIRSGAMAGNMENNVTFTKYGEKRLKHCRKYDFGNGYRMITIQKGSLILIPFLGTHDECDRWLETNNKSKHIGEDKGTVIPILQQAHEPEKTQDDEIPDTNGDQAPWRELSEQDLRIVFSGLVDGAKKRSRQGNKYENRYRMETQI